MNSSHSHDNNQTKDVNEENENNNNNNNRPIINIKTEIVDGEVKISCPCCGIFSKLTAGICINHFNDCSKRVLLIYGVSKDNLPYSASEYNTLKKENEELKRLNENLLKEISIKKKRPSEYEFSYQPFKKVEHESKFRVTSILNNNNYINLHNYNETKHNYISNNVDNNEIPSIPSIPSIQTIQTIQTTQTIQTIQTIVITNKRTNNNHNINCSRSTINL